MSYRGADGAGVALPHRRALELDAQRFGETGRPNHGCPQPVRTATAPLPSARSIPMLHLPAVKRTNDGPRECGSPYEHSARLKLPPAPSPPQSAPRNQTAATGPLRPRPRGDSTCGESPA